MGTSDWCDEPEMFHEDHPHACGDKRVVSHLVNCRKGSSPRVWGQVRDKPMTVGAMRIIPTRVGTSKRYTLPAPLTKDHPHACGDKTCVLPICATVWGSSPRVWGQVESMSGASGQLRIIPTRVGTSLLHGSKHSCNKDHPHACGDKSLKRWSRT